MIRGRLYNPAQLSPEELKASFVARQETLNDMLRLLAEQTPGRPCQHILLVGPRGMGKTTLGLRFLQEVGDVPPLAAAWQPVAFYEESYEISDLADFWLAALRHLTRATNEPQWADTAEVLAKDSRDTEQLAAYALAALLDFCRASGKRLILFVENLDLVFEQVRNERDVYALRASLMEHADILLVGSANSVFDAIRNYGQPFYEFFRLFILRGLEGEECHRIFETFAEHEGNTKVSELLNLEHGRLETVRRLTGGNPRLLALACRLLIESPLGSAFGALEKLIDEQTPYFKARIEELPPQARKVFHCLAEKWTPMLARELSTAAALSSSHASAQLRQLVEKGYAQEVQLPWEKRIRYEVGDRFYNIYYLLRFSRAGRARLERLVAFLHDLFGSTGMRPMYPAALEALDAHIFPTNDISDWLGVLVDYVAGDVDYAGREEWRQKAVALLGRINVCAADEIEKRFESVSRSISGTKRAFELLIAERFTEAETIARELVSEIPDNFFAWTILGGALFRQEHFDEALDALKRGDNVTEHVSFDDPPESREVVFTILQASAFVYLEMEHFEASTDAIQKSLAYLRPDDPSSLRELAMAFFQHYGCVMEEKGKQEEAIAIWQQITEYVHPEDPETLRREAGIALDAKSNALVKLGRHDEVLSSQERVAEYVHVGDSAEMRHLAVRMLLSRGFALIDLEQPEDVMSAWRRASDYVQMDDPIELRRGIARVLTILGNASNSLGRHGESESTCRKATEFDPECGEAWHVLAAAILKQNDDTRLAEAEDCARHAVALEPENADALYTLSDILAHGGKWTRTLEILERVLDIDSAQGNQRRPGLATLLLRLVAAGHGAAVKRIMEDAGLVETMEPLWYAVRSTLGEEIEALPAEIRDTVTYIRKLVVGRVRG